MPFGRLPQKGVLVLRKRSAAVFFVVARDASSSPFVPSASPPYSIPLHPLFFSCSLQRRRRRSFGTPLRLPAPAPVLARPGFAAARWRAARWCSTPRTATPRPRRRPRLQRPPPRDTARRCCACARRLWSCAGNSPRATTRWRRPRPFWIRSLVRRC